jgi:hypothetical protein
VSRDDFALAVLAASGGATHTPVQVQKLFFLLDQKIPKPVGGPHFNFHADNYGPFDVEVYRSLERLANENFVSIDLVQDLRKKMYRTTPEGQVRGEAMLKSFGEPISSYIRSVSEWVRRLSFADLVSAIYAEYPAMRANSIFRHSH